jgi:hypothetical protein
LSKEIGELEEGLGSLVDDQQLYSQFDINPEELRTRIDEILAMTSQFTLKSLIEQYPIERGLSEIITYLEIALRMEGVVVNEDVYETIVVRSNTSGKLFKIKLPQIIICR